MVQDPDWPPSRVLEGGALLSGHGGAPGPGHVPMPANHAPLTWPRARGGSQRPRSGHMEGSAQGPRSGLPCTAGGEAACVTRSLPCTPSALGPHVWGLQLGHRPPLARGGRLELECRGAAGPFRHPGRGACAGAARPLLGAPYSTVGAAPSLCTRLRPRFLTGSVLSGASGSL